MLLTIESLRTDYVGAYGGRSRTRPEVPLTPNLDALSEEAIVYTDAHAVTSWTLTSHASLFTGLYPTTHQTIRHMDRLGKSYTTMAEVLSEAGYQTAAFVSGPYLRRAHGLDQGFEIYDDSIASAENAKAHGDVTNPQMEAALSHFVREQRDPKRPFFLFAYVWDPHYDYIPPSPYDQMFSDETCEPIQLSGYENNAAIRPSMKGSQLAYVRSQYAGEIRWTDDFLGRFFRLLREAGLWDDTVIIVTADHGEEFFDHGAKGHKNNLYSETVHVPLIIKRREGRARRDTRLVSHVDLLPTVAEIAGAKPPALIQGRSLFEGPPEQQDRAVFYELLATRYLPHETRVQLWRGVRKGSYKLVWNDRKVRGEELRLFHLFDVERDPTEANDLVRERPEVLWNLFETYENWAVRAKKAASLFEHGGTADLSEPEIERLRSLGYLD